MTDAKLVKQLLDAVRKSQTKGTQGYDSQAVVNRVEGNTIWVHIPGGVDETPIRKTISADVGDTIQIRVAGGRAFAVGNETSPPTDDKKAEAANKAAATAGAKAKAAQKTAEEAGKTAKKKAEVFQTFDQTVPSPPYNIGDMWILTYLGENDKRVRELYTCTTARNEEEEFNQDDWTLSATDDYAAAEALGIANSLLGWSETIDALVADLTPQSEFEQKTNDLSGRISDLDWYGYMKLYGRDEGTPVIELGSRERSAFVLIATPSRLGFYRNNGESGLETTATAYFGESATQGLFGLIAGVLEAQKYLTVGNFIVIANADGGLTIKKVGL